MNNPALNVVLSRLRRVRNEIIHDGEIVPAELDARIDEIVGLIKAKWPTDVIPQSEIQRSLPTCLTGT